MIKIWREVDGDHSVLLEEIEGDFVTAIINAQQKYPNDSIRVDGGEGIAVGFTPETPPFDEASLRESFETTPYTVEQEKTVGDLESKGWTTVSPPERHFNYALMIEDTSGVSHYVLPDGSVGDSYR